MKKSNGRYASTQRAGRGTKTETTSHQRTATTYTSILDKNTLDDKIQALLDQNKMLNEKLRIKLTTEQSQLLQQTSADIDISWSTPKLLDEDDRDKDFSINAGSYIKKESISGESIRGILQRMVHLERIIEDQDRTIGELKQIYKESILNGDVIAENKKLVRENYDLQRAVDDLEQRVARYQEFQATIEPQFRELALENQKLTNYLAQQQPQQECSQRIVALERELKQLRSILQQENHPPHHDESMYLPVTPTKQLENYQTERSSELLRRLNCLSQNLINCTKR